MLATQDMKNWVKLTRAQTMFVTVATIWSGYMTVTDITVESGIILAYIAGLMHLSGFADNEIQDYHYDKRLDGAEGHVLASGDIDISKANKVVRAMMVMLGVSYFIVFGVTLALCTIILSHLSGIAYNAYSKKHWYAPVYLGFWGMFLVLAGAMYAGNINSNTILLSIGFFLFYFTNVMEGDIKDINNPEESILEKLDVEYLEDANKIYYSGKSKIFVKVVKGLQLVFILSIADLTYDLDYLILIGMSASLYTVTHGMWMVSRLDREKILKAFHIHGSCSGLLISVVMVSYDMIGSLIMLALSIGWTLGVNYAVSEGAVNPDV